MADNWYIYYFWSARWADNLYIYYIRTARVADNLLYILLGQHVWADNNPYVISGQHHEWADNLYLVLVSTKIGLTKYVKSICKTGQTLLLYLRSKNPEIFYDLQNSTTTQPKLQNSFFEETSSGLTLLH